MFWGGVLGLVAGVLSASGLGLVAEVCLVVGVVLVGVGEGFLLEVLALLVLVVVTAFLTVVFLVVAVVHAVPLGVVVAVVAPGEAPWAVEVWAITVAAAYPKVVPLAQLPFT